MKLNKLLLCECLLWNFPIKIEPVWSVRFQSLTVCLQSPWFTAPASCLVDGLDDKDILGAALQAVYRVVVLLDVGHNHPAVQRVTETWGREGKESTEESDGRYRSRSVKSSR